MPDLYIITGSNGAGKSSVGITYLPADIAANFPVFDGDKIFVNKRNELFNQGMRSHKEMRNVAFEFVSNQFDELVNKALMENTTFVYEGHFTNDATWEIPDRFRKAGYNIHMIFLGLRDPDLSEIRVIDRSHLGGHFVDRKTVEANYYGNLEKLNKYAHLIHDLKIFDTSEVSHVLLAECSDGKVNESKPYSELPKWFIQYLPVFVTQIYKQKN